MSLAPPLHAADQRGDSGELPLRLSQMLAKPAPGRKPPLWMTRPDEGASLRAARQLSLVAAPAGAGAAADGPAVIAGSNGSAESTAGAPEMVGGLPVSGAAAGPAATGGIGGTGWEIPPIRWGGSVGYSYQHGSNDTGYSSVSHGVFSNLAASSYIYAPWFARVSGRIGINSSTSSSSGSGDGGEERNRSSNLVGGGELNMFSSSRFPFRTYYDRSDSRSSGTFVANDYVSDRYGFSQSLRSEDSQSNGNFLFDRSAISSSDGRRDNVTALSGTYSTTTGIVQNNVSARYSLGEQSGTGNRAALFGLNSSHTANVSETLNLGGIMNFSDSDIRTGTSDGATTSSRGRYLQLYTYGSWLPEFEDLDDLPLTLNGGLRYTSQEASFDGSNFNAQTVGGNLSGLYRLTRNLSLSANSALTRITQTQGETQTLIQLGSGINYAADVLTFGKYSYNWNTGANTNWQSAVGTTPANAVSSGQFGHNLGRVVMLSPGQALSLNAAQTVNVTNSQMVGNSQSLSHTLSANLGVASGERFSGSLSAMFSDVQTSGYIEQHYRVFNLGFFGQGQLSQVSSATVNMMFNWSDQSYQTVDSFGVPVTQGAQRMTLNGSAVYTHQRFAGLRGLRYNMIFTADSRLRDERLYGNVEGDYARARYSLTNRLEYRVGLLDLRLSLIHNDVGGKKNALLFFQVARQIGSY